jgi:hypothetical protein
MTKLDAAYRGDSARELISAIQQVEKTMFLLNPKMTDKRFVYKLSQNRDEVTITAELI